MQMPIVAPSAGSNRGSFAISCDLRKLDTDATLAKGVIEQVSWK
jgi:hypothetical protein